MKKYFWLSISSVLIFGLAHLDAKEKRTDGPPGSEFADFGSFEGDLSIGGQFGALLSTRSSGSSSFSIGLDADYRPYDLFGFRFTYFQGFKSPKASIFSLTPLVHTAFSNFRPYLLGGPGIAILNEAGTTAKFIVSLGLGADVELTTHLGIGMLWTFHAIIDSSDIHALAARISYKF